MRTKSIVILTIALLFAAGCSGSGPNKPDNTLRPLAGGGRLDNTDPFTGNPDSSGNTFPDITPEQGVYPLYYAHTDCANTPQNVIISDSAAWKQWWDAVAGCQWRGDPRGPMIPQDSNWVPGDSSQPCGGRCETDPPYIDFEQYVIAAISIEYDSGGFCHRSVWVNSVAEEDGHTVIKYEVSLLDQSCCDLMLAMFIPMGFSPVVAVQIERPILEPVEWVRTNTTFDCPGPGPNEPMTLHYTDAPCDLGPGEEIITDSAQWQAWFHAAWACDSARFGGYGWGGGVTPGEDGTDPNGDSLPPWPDTTVIGPYPWWGMPYVDFTTHAVIVLRAGEQTRWGGGIWLNSIDHSAGGTVYDYSVMEPSDDCPGMDGMGMMDMVVNPTVAIRVPLPIDPPVTWLRNVESIKCDWGNDSSWVYIDPNGGRP